MSTIPTIPDLQILINALSVRLAVLDGQGLASPAVGFIQQNAADMTGLKNDVDGSALALEALIDNLTSQVQTLQASVNTLLGLSGATVPTVSARYVTPPTTLGAKAPPTTKMPPTV